MSPKIPDKDASVLGGVISRRGLEYIRRRRDALREESGAEPVDRFVPDATPKATYRGDSVPTAPIARPKPRVTRRLISSAESNARWASLSGHLEDPAYDLMRHAVGWILDVLTDFAVDDGENVLVPEVPVTVDDKLLRGSQMVPGELMGAVSFYLEQTGDAAAIFEKARMITVLLAAYWATYAEPSSDAAEANLGPRDRLRATLRAAMSMEQGGTLAAELNHFEASAGLLPQFERGWDDVVSIKTRDDRHVGATALHALVRAAIQLEFARTSAKPLMRASTGTVARQQVWLAQQMLGDVHPEISRFAEELAYAIAAPSVSEALNRGVSPAGWRSLIRRLIEECDSEECRDRLAHVLNDSEIRTLSLIKTLETIDAEDGDAYEVDTIALFHALAELGAAQKGDESPAQQSDFFMKLSSERTETQPVAPDAEHAARMGVTKALVHMMGRMKHQMEYGFAPIHGHALLAHMAAYLDSTASRNALSPLSQDNPPHAALAILLKYDNVASVENILHHGLLRVERTVAKDEASILRAASTLTMAALYSGRVRRAHDPAQREDLARKAQGFLDDPCITGLHIEQEALRRVVAPLVQDWSGRLVQGLNAARNSAVPRVLMMR